MRISDIVLIGVVLTLLTAPGVLTVHRIVTGEEDRVSEEERRRLATVTGWSRRLSDGRLGVNEAGPALADAFKDQLVFRRTLTRPYNLALLHLGHSTADRISVGPNQYWFQTEAPTFRRVACATPDGIEMERSRQMLREYAEFAERAEARGVRVLAILVPLKATLYPEHLPEPMRSRCMGAPGLQEAVAEVQAGAERPFIAYDVDWFRAQGEGFMYDPREFHWSRAGAQRYWRYLVTEGALAGEITPPPLGRSVFTDDLIDNAYDLGVAPLTVNRERFALEISPDESGRAEFILEDEVFQRFVPIFRNGDTDRLLMARGGPRDGTGVLVGDSFTANVWPFFRLYFDTTYRFMTNDLLRQPGDLDAIIEATDPDYLIFLLTDSKWFYLAEDEGPSTFEQMMYERP